MVLILVVLTIVVFLAIELALEERQPSGQRSPRTGPRRREETGSDRPGATAGLLFHRATRGRGAFRAASCRRRRLRDRFHRSRSPCLCRRPATLVKDSRRGRSCRRRTPTFSRRADHGRGGRGREARKCDARRVAADRRAVDAPRAAGSFTARLRELARGSPRAWLAAIRDALVTRHTCGMSRRTAERGIQSSATRSTTKPGRTFAASSSGAVRTDRGRRRNRAPRIGISTRRVSRVVALCIVLTILILDSRLPRRAREE
jgi:hypothetical protein